MVLVEKYRKVNEDFEQSYYGRTAKGVYKLSDESIRFLEWMAYYDGFHENVNSFDLMDSILNFLNEIS